jgi:hypothetical protein
MKYSDFTTLSVVIPLGGVKSSSAKVLFLKAELLGLVIAATMAAIELVLQNHRDDSVLSKLVQFIKNKVKLHKIKDNVAKAKQQLFPKAGKMSTDIRRKPQETDDGLEARNTHQPELFEQQIKELEKDFTLEFGESGELEEIIEKSENVTPEEAKKILEKVVVAHEQQCAEIRETHDPLEQSILHDKAAKLISLLTKGKLYKDIFNDSFSNICRLYAQELTKRSKYYKGVFALKNSEVHFIKAFETYDYDEMIVNMGDGICALHEALEELKITQIFPKTHDSIKESVSELIDIIKNEFESWVADSEEDKKEIAKDKTSLLGRVSLIAWGLQQLDKEIEEKLEKEKLLSLYPNRQTYIYMERQGKIFDDMLPTLAKHYAGKYVHFEDGKVLDYDDNKSRLVTRVLEKDSSKQTFIEKVPSSLPLETN